MVEQFLLSVYGQSFFGMMTCLYILLMCTKVLNKMSTCIYYVQLLFSLLLILLLFFVQLIH